MELHQRGEQDKRGMRADAVAHSRETEHNKGTQQSVFETQHLFHGPPVLLHTCVMDVR